MWKWLNKSIFIIGTAWIPCIVGLVLLFVGRGDQTLVGALGGVLFVGGGSYGISYWTLHNIIDLSVNKQITERQQLTRIAAVYGYSWGGIMSLIPFLGLSMFADLLTIFASMIIPLASWAIKGNTKSEPERKRYFDVYKTYSHHKLRVRGRTIKRTQHK